MSNLTVTIKGLEITASARDVAELVNLLSDEPVKPKPPAPFAAEEVELPKHRMGDRVNYEGTRYFVVGQDMHGKNYLLAQPGEGLKVATKVPFHKID